jgi:hypothetical protein
METTKEFLGYVAESVWLSSCTIAAALILWKRLADIRRRRRDESREAEIALRMVEEQLEAAERKEREQRVRSDEMRGGLWPPGSLTRG